MKNASTFALMILIAASTSLQAATQVYKKKETDPIATAKTASSVRLISFTTEVTATGAVVLHWTTTREENNASYVIERSSDAQHFEVVQQIVGAGNSQEKRSYQLLDAAPLKGISYYRLRQTGLNGQSSVTKPIVLEVQADTQPSVAIEVTGAAESTSITTLRMGK